jgi:hypothetical protein
VGDTFIRADHIPAGAIWRFAAPVAADGAVRAVPEAERGRSYRIHQEIAAR